MGGWVCMYVYMCAYVCVSICACMCVLFGSLPSYYNMTTIILLFYVEELFEN